VVVWILLLVYKTGLVEQIDELRPVVSNGGSTSLDSAVHDGTNTGRAGLDETTDVYTVAGTIVTGTTRENHDEFWKSLSPNHWPTLFAYYNISLTGRFVMLIPHSFFLLH